MTRWLLVLALLLLPLPVSAQGVGIFSRPDCTTITSPVSGSTACLDTTRGVWLNYDGTGFQSDVARATGAVIANDSRWGLSTAASAAVNATAMTDALAAATTVVVRPGTYTINAFTIPRGSTVIMPAGAVFAVAAGQTILVSGSFQAGSYQIFSSSDVTTATQPVRWRTAATEDIQQPWISATWWGAVGDASTDNSIALQQFFLAGVNADDSPSKQCCAPRLIIPPGQYNYASALFIQSKRPGAQTISIRGFQLEGVSGGGTTLQSSVTGMQTRLHYTGAGVGITIGDTTFQLRGGSIRNLWFSGTATATFGIQAWANMFVFDAVLFSGFGDSGTDSGLRWTAFQSEIRNSAFVENFNGLWLDASTTTTVRDNTFTNHTGNCALAVIGTQHLLQSNVFQNSAAAAVADAICLDMGASWGTGGITQVTIANNYWEVAGGGGGNRILIRGENAGNRVRAVHIRDNYESSFGAGTTNFIMVVSHASDIRLSRNFFGRDVAGITTIEAGYGPNAPININIDIDGGFRHGGTYNGLFDLNTFSQVLTNSGQGATASTYTLPRAIPGLRFRVVKVDSGNITVTAGGSDTINGAASIANTTAGDAGSATLELLAVVDSGTVVKWVIVSREGTWA